MHTFLFIALLGSVSAPEASTLPFPTSDLDQRAQDHNHSYGLITHGSSHGLMTHGLIPGSLPVDTLNHNTTAHPGSNTTAHPGSRVDSQDYPADSRLGRAQEIVLPDDFRLFMLNAHAHDMG